jgi:hypothetical protein
MDGNEGAVATARRFPMNRPGEPALSGPRLSFDQDGRVRGFGDLVDASHELSDDFGLAREQLSVLASFGARHATSALAWLARSGEIFPLFGSMVAIERNASPVALKCGGSACLGHWMSEGDQPQTTCQLVQ